MFWFISKKRHEEEIADLQDVVDDLEMEATHDAMIIRILSRQSAEAAKSSCNLSDVCPWRNCKPE